MYQLFHPAYRHLWFLSALAIMGMWVLGFAHEKMAGQMTFMAIVGFSASIVHGSAWWFTYHSARPWKKLLCCGMLLTGAMGSVVLGRMSHFQIVDGNFDSQLHDVVGMGGVVAAIWLVSVAVNEVVKFALRWHIVRHDIDLRTSITITDLFEWTAIVGVMVAVCKPMLIPLLSHGTEFIWILIASLVLQVLVLIPLAAITLRPLRSATSRAVSVGIALVTLAVLVLLSMSVLLSDDFGPIAAVSVVLMSLVFPFYVMLLAAREHHLNIVSGWFPQELLH